MSDMDQTEKKFSSVKPDLYPISMDVKIIFLDTKVRPTNAVKSFRDLNCTVEKNIKCFWNEYFSYGGFHTKSLSH